jgi:hypothetical protein
VAYRGRALVELQTILGESPEVPVEEIPGEDLIRAQVRKMPLDSSRISTNVSKPEIPTKTQVQAARHFPERHHGDSH